MHGRQIKIFLVEGTPTGLKTAELGLSTCKAVVAPRSSLAVLRRRPEATRTGVYILVGHDPDHAGRAAVYVGEGDDVFSRINRHDKDEDKEFWDYVVLFVSKDDNLTKAHVRHLEGKLIQLAMNAKRSKVVNATAPDFDLLPEADLAEMAELLEHIKLLLGTLGVDAFQAGPAHVDTVETTAASASIQLSMQGKGYSATCVFDDGSFNVLQGSLARTDEAPSISNGVRSTRVALCSNGVLEAGDDGLAFTQDYRFDSASAAAGVVSGTTLNGKVAWQLKDGRTFKQWEQDEIDAAEGEQGSA